MPLLQRPARPSEQDLPRPLNSARDWGWGRTQECVHLCVPLSKHVSLRVIWAGVCLSRCVNVGLTPSDLLGG